MEEIDIVITWVDGGDTDWLKEKAKYSNLAETTESIDPARFRDWGTLKYVLRSIEQNATWVNKIFLVTANQIPSWFKSQDKLVIVNHTDFIPSEFLPTFSSHVIECFINRIPGLSKKFIYFNDDTMVLRPSKSSDFFVNDKPCDYASLHIHAVKESLMIHQIANNDISIINEHFDINNQLKQYRFKWFNPKYGIKRLLKTFILSKSPRFPGMEQHHMPQPYLRKTFEEVWEAEPALLLKTASHKFRDRNDINQWLFRDWQLASGNFEPVSPRNRGLMIDFEKNDEIEELEKCERELQKKKYLMICINDGDSIQNHELIMSRVQGALESTFPRKAPWER